MSKVSSLFIKETRDLTNRLSSIDLSDLPYLVYNPLDYASKVNELYISRYLKKGVKYLLLGMNPGPFGMAQTGVPFGDVVMVRDWLGLKLEIKGPKVQHPKRPVLGFECNRKEVSGSRLWSWARDKYIEPDKFFENFFVWNYCPLVFMEQGGANKTPDKLPANVQDLIFSHCNYTLRKLVSIAQIELVIGVGKFARKRAEDAVGDIAKVGDILHPSPASPMANRGWSKIAEKQLRELSCFSS